MKLDSNKIWDKVKNYQRLTHKDYIELNVELGLPHTHDLCSLEIFNSKRFNLYSSSIPLCFPHPDFWFQKWYLVFNSLNKLENKINLTSLNEINYDHFLKYVDIFISYMHPKHFPSLKIANFEPWKYKTKDNILELENLLEVISTLKQKSIIPLEEIESYWRPILNHGWGCVQIGEFDIALFLSKFIWDEAIKNIGSSHTSRFFSNQEHNNKTIYSGGLLLAKAYIGKGEIKKALEIYNIIHSFNKEFVKKSNNHHIPYLFYTRMLEVAVEMYNISPTERNKQKCLWWFKTILKKNLSWDQHTVETARERSLVVYFFFRSIYGYKLD